MKCDGCWRKCRITISHGSRTAMCSSTSINLRTPALPSSAAGSNGFPRMLQPDYSLVNLRLGLNPEGGHWLTEFYVTNLTDKNAVIYTNTGNFDLRLTTNEPRVLGVRLNYRFGKEGNSE